MREEALLFGKTRSLVGIITDPPEAERGKHLPAIILLNAGIIHHVGPHRLYVKMARSLAAMGFVVFRFDLSGVGDSTVRADNLPFEKSAVSETQEAMDVLSTARGTEHFLLSGICSGALIALTTAYCDPRVVGVIPINAPRHKIEYAEDEEEIRAYVINYKINNKTIRIYWDYWKTVLFNSQVWLKAITGKANYPLVIQWTISITRTMASQIRSKVIRKHIVSFRAKNVVSELHALTERGVRLLFVYSTRDSDLGLDYFRVVLGNEIRALIKGGKLHVEIIPQADHLFTLLRHQERLLQAICIWLKRTLTI
jgi:pimeloyl-ACP methyl ester carboxylesterase